MRIKDIVLAGSLLALGVACIVLMVVTNLFGLAVKNTESFVGEQQPSAKNVGELIGKQYSQLREYSASLDDLACRIQTNEAAYDDLRSTYKGEEVDWPTNIQTEAQNLRWEHTALLQRYSSVAKEYNILRTDVRTLADNLGLQVQDIPHAEEMSPIEGMCGNFTLNELP